MAKLNKITPEVPFANLEHIIETLNKVVENQNEIINYIGEIENERLEEKNEQFENLWRRIEKELKDWPNKGDNYYYLDDGLDAIMCNFDNDKIDSLRKESGNMFKTKEQAEEAANRIKNVLYYFHNPVDET